MFKRRGAGDFGVRAPDGKSGEIRERRPVRERRLREEGEGADRRARGLSKSDARAGGEGRLTRGAQLADGAGWRRGTRAGDAGCGR